MFNQVANRLLKQSRASICPNTGWCEYRTPNGLKCAIGHLIPDHKYVLSFEGKTGKSLPLFKCLPEEIKKLISAMQKLHDIELRRHGLKIWAQKMAILADEHGLEYK